MSPNSDNAMARFLFAIIKQKNLKDIDWNEVANDPVLLQPITNGHAARMRFSRFRTTVTGSSTQKRVRSNSKSRVTKPKNRNGSTKSENLEADIKQEHSHHQMPLSTYSPASAASPYMADNLNPRLLTPCSDDMSNAFLVNPSVVDHINHQGHVVDFMSTVVHPYSPDDLSVLDDTFDISSISADSVSHSLADSSPLWNDNLQPHF